MRQRITVGLFLFAVAASGQMLGPIVFGGSSAPASIFLGYGCNGTPTITSCTVGGTPQNGLVGFSLATPITTGSNAHGYDVKACWVNFPTLDATSKGFSCAIYTTIASTGPFCVVTAGTNATATGWSANTNYACHLDPSTTYTICYQTQGSGTAGARDVSAGVGFASGATYPTTFANPGSSSFTTGFTYSQALEVIPTS